MNVLRTLYPHGFAFDYDYYFGRHLPLAERLMAEFRVSTVELMRILQTEAGATAPFELVSTVYFESESELQRARRSEQWHQLVADIPNYYRGTPLVLIGEVLAPPSR